MNNRIINLTLTVFFIVTTAILAVGETTEFTYQGSLKNTGAPAKGNYDFEFALFDAHKPDGHHDDEKR